MDNLAKVKVSCKWKKGWFTLKTIHLWANLFIVFVLLVFIFVFVLIYIYKDTYQCLIKHL